MNFGVNPQFKFVFKIITNSFMRVKFQIRQQVSYSTINQVIQRSLNSIKYIFERNILFFSNYVLHTLIQNVSVLRYI